MNGSVRRWMKSIGIWIYDDDSLIVPDYLFRNYSLCDFFAGNFSFYQVLRLEDLKSYLDVAGGSAHEEQGEFVDWLIDAIRNHPEAEQACLYDYFWQTLCDGVRGYRHILSGQFDRIEYVRDGNRVMMKSDPDEWDWKLFVHHAE